jgi:hypothetical protein
MNLNELKKLNAVELMKIAENLAITEKVFGEFTDNNMPDTKKYRQTLDWKGKNWTSYLVSRLFDMEKEYKRLVDKYNKIKDEKVIFSYNEKSKRKNKFLEENISSEKLWDKYNFSALLHETPCKKKEFKCQAKFKTTWDNNYFYFEMTLVDNGSKIKKIEEKNKFNYKCKLLFGKTNEFPRIIFINPEYGEDDCFFGGRELESKRVELKTEEKLTKKNHYVKIKIPWEYINVEPEPGKEILMDVNIIENNKNEGWEKSNAISWATGKCRMIHWRHKCNLFNINKIKLV